MSRRNQSHRRRSYGRRQHEVRERRPGEALPADWMDSSADVGWTDGWSDGDEGHEQDGTDQDGLRSFSK